MKVKGKTIWITGASAGIGEALAENLFNRGATIILSARSVDRLEAIRQRLDAVEKGRCHVVPCDVTNQESIKAALLQVEKLTDRVDILINNAGVSQRSTVADTSLQVIRDLMEVNFFSAVSVTKGILPKMISQGGGHIVVISSMAGKFGFRMRSGYSAAKHALQGFFETLRAEMHDKNIQVTLICPGRVKTDISINSLTGDGSAHGKMDAGQTRGVPVKKCAEIIVRSVENNRKEVFIGKGEVFLLIVKRICPALYYYLVSRVSAT